MPHGFWDERSLSFALSNIIGGLPMFIIGPGVVADVVMRQQSTPPTDQDINLRYCSLAHLQTPYAPPQNTITLCYLLLPLEITYSKEEAYCRI